MGTKTNTHLSYVWLTFPGCWIYLAQSNSFVNCNNLEGAEQVSKYACSICLDVSEKAQFCFENNNFFFHLCALKFGIAHCIFYDNLIWWNRREKEVKCITIYNIGIIHENHFLDDFLNIKYLFETQYYLKLLS